MQMLPPDNIGGSSHLLILRPAATMLLAAATLLAGIISYRFPPITVLPEVDYPII